ncbi:MAG: hypothetical protein HND48_14180 [Chloroflexi bacterium]|nr:hypothetical protein [Chloroflexota bacterium]
MAEVIEARTEEIFEKCRDEIKRSGYDGLLRAGAVLTGGTSQLPGIEELAKQMLGIPIRLARPERLTGLGDMLKAPAYSTSIGLLRLGLQARRCAGGRDLDPYTNSKRQMGRTRARPAQTPSARRRRISGLRGPLPHPDMLELQAYALGCKS